MKTKEFDDKVRELVFNPYLLPKSKGYKPGDSTFDGFGYNLLSKNTFKVYSLLSHIDKVLNDPAESIEWLCRKLNIDCDIYELDIEPIDKIYDNIHQYLLNDIDEETGTFWLFENQDEANKFLDSCNKIIHYSDILLVGNAYQFDIIHNAELFADTVYGSPSFYHFSDNLLEHFDEISSKYFRAVYAGIVYYWSAKNGLLTNRLHIFNDNKDNYKN